MWFTVLCNHNGGDFFICEDSMLFSHVKVLYEVSVWRLTWYLTGVYIIKSVKSLGFYSTEVTVLCTFQQGNPELSFVQLEQHFLLLDLKKYKQYYDEFMWSTHTAHTVIQSDQHVHVKKILSDRPRLLCFPVGPVEGDSKGVSQREVPVSLYRVAQWLECLSSICGLFYADHNARLSLRAVTHNFCYAWVSFVGPYQGPTDLTNKIIITITIW